MRQVEELADALARAAGGKHDRSREQGVGALGCNGERLAERAELGLGIARSVGAQRPRGREDVELPCAMFGRRRFPGVLHHAALPPCSAHGLAAADELDARTLACGEERIAHRFCALAHGEEEVSLAASCQADRMEPCGEVFFGRGAHHGASHLGVPIMAWMQQGV